MKNNNPFTYLIITVILLSAAACDNKNKYESNTTEKNIRPSEQISVDTIRLCKKTFRKQTICNGKLSAVVKSNLSFHTTGNIARILVRNGDHISQGTVLAVLDKKAAEQELSKTRRAMKKAAIDLTDKLIGQGYNADTTAVPATILQNMKATSGYDTSLDQLHTAEKQVEDCYLKAPFSGRVANLDAKVYDKAPDIFCTLIDDTYFDVEFNILEAEMSEVNRGQNIILFPFINKEQKFTGIITEVNPLINERGQLKVRAKVHNRNNYLIEGMNVKIVLEREVERQFVVPKDAVVIRDGYHVVFRYENGHAVWTYVDVALSNIDSHVITGNAEKQTSIKEDDIIIISNNLNLADGTRVTPHPASAKPQLNE